MNFIRRWAVVKWLFTLMLQMLCLGWAISAHAQDGTTTGVTCATINKAGGAQKTVVNPDRVVTVSTSTGGTLRVLGTMSLFTNPGDAFTFTLSPAVSETSASPLTPVAKVAQWRLETFDPALITYNPPNTIYPPTTIVASGGTLGSTLTYKATTAGLTHLLIAADQLDGYATLTVGCTNPTSVPTLSEIALVLLGLLVTVAAVRSNAGRHGLKP